MTGHIPCFEICEDFEAWDRLTWPFEADGQPNFTYVFLVEGYWEEDKQKVPDAQ